MTVSCSPIDVCAAIIGRGPLLLLAQRPPGKHLGGFWEFPGGKVEEGEALFRCIRREIMEELGLRATPLRQLLTVEHVFPDRKIRLHCIECSIPADADPIHHEGQRTRWLPVDQLETLPLAPADRSVAQWLRNPTAPPPAASGVTAHVSARHFCADP